MSPETNPFENSQIKIEQKDQEKTPSAKNIEKQKEAANLISRFIKYESPLLADFAGDSSLEFVPDDKESTFLFLPESYQVKVPVKWFIEREFSPDQMKWALYHELGHFIDMRKNPKAFLKNFERMRKEIAPKIAEWIDKAMQQKGVSLEKIKKLKQRKIPIGKEKQKMNSLELWGYEIIRSFYNVFDDIYVNNLLEQRAPYYSTEDGKEKIAQIYREKLGFGSPDLTKKPRHLQFLYSLLRKEMLPKDTPSKITQEVESALKEKTYGKNVEQLIEKHLKPKSGKLINPEDRYIILRKKIESIYLNLAKKDLEEMDFSDIEREIEKASQKTQEQKGKGESEGEDESEGEGEGKDEGEREGEDEDEGKGKGESEGEDESEGEGEGKDEGEREGEDEDEGKGKGESEGEDESEGEGEGKDEGEGESESESEGEGEGEGKGKGKGKGEGKGKGKGKDEDEGKGKSYPGAGGGFDFRKIIEEHENKNNPDNMLSDEEIQKILKKFKEEEEFKKMSPEERAQKDFERLKKEFDRKHGISSETRKIFEKTARKIAPFQKQMREFWKRLIGRGMELQRKKQHYQSRGSSVNIDDFIRELPEIHEKIQTGKSLKPKIYERFKYEMLPGHQPERIEVSIVADMSGSMNHPQKIKALREAVLLVLSSLKDFNDYLDFIRKKTKTKLQADSEVYVFGSTFHKAKSFDKELKQKGKTTQASIIKTFEYLQETIGSTNNAAVLGDILKHINSEDEKNIKKRKLMKIVFEITDGNPNSPNETRKRIDELLERGIMVVGFKIGENPQEKRVFDEIWNEGRTQKLGIYLGNEIEKLPIELLKKLKELMRSVKI